MPDVTLKYGGGEVAGPGCYNAIVELGYALPDIIAKALNVEDTADPRYADDPKAGNLVADEIEVSLVPRAPVTINGKNVIIRIEATDFAERMANRDKRSKEIYEQARSRLPATLSLGVWFVPVGGSWASD